MASTSYTETDSNINSSIFIAQNAKYTQDSHIDATISILGTKDAKTKKRKKSKLSNCKRKRKDIISKALFRMCRKYYQSEFYAFCRYASTKKRQPESYYFDQIQSFVKSRYSVDSDQDLCFYMASLINSKDTKKSLRYFVQDEDELVKKEQEITKIHDILYKFTHDKMRSFFEYPQLKFLFSNFVEKQKDNIPKGFGTQLQLMMELA